MQWFHRPAASTYDHSRIALSSRDRVTLCQIHFSCWCWSICYHRKSSHQFTFTNSPNFVHVFRTFGQTCQILAVFGRRYCFPVLLWYWPSVPLLEHLNFNRIFLEYSEYFHPIILLQLFRHHFHFKSFCLTCQICFRDRLIFGCVPDGHFFMRLDFCRFTHYNFRHNS